MPRRATGGGRRRGKGEPTMDDGRPSTETQERDELLSDSTAGYWDHYVHLADERTGGEGASCLRPLGRCELGGACDLCIHNPERSRPRT